MRQHGEGHQGGRRPEQQPPRDGAEGGQEDSDAWQWNPAHRWVYDKLAIALSQNLDAGPHGIEPPRFPVFSKPIVNLKGMGAGSRVLHSQADYDEHYAPGHFWMPLLDGRHLSTDIAVVDGEPRWWRHVTGEAAGGGRAWISSFTKRAAPGATIDIPFAHKDALYVRSHYDGITITLHDVPLPDEIALICAYATRGRPNHRVGGLAAADIKSIDGLT